ncbi:hypothetical protein [Anaerotignum sp. MSJ-24]|nr:hypothetical protein [Anaerotignum sp. MSJ-24]
MKKAKGKKQLEDMTYKLSAYTYTLILLCIMATIAFKLLHLLF